MPFPAGDTLLILPELFLTTAALVVLLWATVASREGERSLAFFSIGALAATGLLLFLSARAAGALPRSAFGGMFVMDRFGLYFKAILILVSIVTILFSLRFIGAASYPGGEYYGLLLFATVGMLFMASGTHLASIVVALEL
ncbi:MAG TPA: hypothetical protein VF554_03330, partial [Thermoanaerobaculia bacterium]